MSILHLDHVNICTARYAESLAFYGEVLGLDVRTPPMAANMSGGAWAYDARGCAVLHLVATSHAQPGEPAVRGTARPGMIDHFALRCDELRPIRAALEARGLPYDLLEVPQIGSLLLFVRDPNGIMVELNSPLTT